MAPAGAGTAAHATGKIDSAPHDRPDAASGFHAALWEIDVFRFPISNRSMMAPLFERLYELPAHARGSAEAAVPSVPQFFVITLKRFALPLNDAERIRTPVGGAQWMSSPCP